MDISMDKLTGLRSREAIISYLEDKLSGDGEIGIALADVDFFVNIDSKLGSEEGDKILQRIALFFSGCEDATVGRYGGDEFLLIFDNADRESFMARLDSIRKSFRKQRFIGEYSIYAKTPMTVSFGGAISREGEKNAELLLKSTEIALAMSKKGGRNQAVFAPKVCIHVTGNKEEEMSTVAGGGLRGFGGDMGPAFEAKLLEPYGVDVLNKTDLVFADRGNHRIRKITKDGMIETIAGEGDYGYSGDEGPAIHARLNKPSGAAVDSEGCIYVADTGNHCIRKIDCRGLISTLAGCGGEGYEGDNGKARHAKLSRPGGVVVDGYGNVYTNDYGNNVIRMITKDGIIRTIAGCGKFGYSGDGEDPLKASLDRPYGLAVSSRGEFVFIADYGNHCVRIVDTEKRCIRTVCGTGEPGYSGDGMDARYAALNSPFWVSTWTDKYLLVADAGNHCIRIINLLTNRIETLVGNGSPGYWDGRTEDKKDCLNIPAGMAVDNENRILYIADYGNNAIRRFIIKGIPC